ncbi:DUF2065 domain-containing protein [Actibacterium sp. 188UL27-1]|uniref:DUF2065 domain-containing protein n=1 Tax=Actibacterium sp. 188UL27-1 TaxID=2786961 RepID=UPI001959CAD1|nr:DUF2065 domain-containing protein [Actibacterium sp. 188UL27-1]MBM7068560.1 DUF2065 domain-containing protein [Actibacterium sp. 188UL27-1]
MTTVLLALGLVLVIEGLVLALLPDRLDQILEQLAEIPVEARRMLGLLAMTLGGTFAWLVHWISG